ncbi:MAG: 6,7-dimethyl-8-ribityllumazine synthase [Dehalococcoidia bacterium]
MPTVYEGDEDASGLRFAIVASRFNDFITRKLLDGAVERLTARGAADGDIDVYWVPGAFEIPLVAQAAAKSGRYQAILCLGAVIRGETDHYTLVAEESARGIARVALETGVPCIFEVLATPTVELAMARAGGEAGNKGEEAATAAVQAARVLALAHDAQGS